MQSWHNIGYFIVMCQYDSPALLLLELLAETENLAVPLNQRQSYLSAKENETKLEENRKQKRLLFLSTMRAYSFSHKMAGQPTVSITIVIKPHY
jgi:hypothetical protein